jgi:hypothetical protein
MERFSAGISAFFRLGEYYGTDGKVLEPYKYGILKKNSIFIWSNHIYQSK